MALIKCPECGRENISDTAKACPECGFDFVKYNRQIQKENIKKGISDTTKSSGFKKTIKIIIILGVIFLVFLISVAIFIGIISVTKKKRAIQSVHNFISLERGMHPYEINELFGKPDESGNEQIQILADYSYTGFCEYYNIEKIGGHKGELYIEYYIDSKSTYEERGLPEFDTAEWKCEFQNEKDAQECFDELEELIIEEMGKPEEEEDSTYWNSDDRDDYWWDAEDIWYLSGFNSNQRYIKLYRKGNIVVMYNEKRWEYRRYGREIN